MKSSESRTSNILSKRRDFINKKHKNINFKSQLLTLKIAHKIFNYFNLSLFCLIIIYSFIAFKSQREWTEIYSSMLKIRITNDDLNGYISKTEEHFLNKVDIQDQFKKATSRDLIYLEKPLERNNKKFLFSDFVDGLKDGKYQRGY